MRPDPMPDDLRLQAFGGLQVNDLGGRPLVRQRLRLAFLTYLALAGDRGRTRDRLLAMFWPESPETSARHSLDQLLSSIRQQLGESIFAGPPDPVRLNLERLTSDVAAYETRFTEGRLAEAVALQQGPFLDGFHLGGEGGFDDWAEGERRRFEETQSRALERLAVAAEADRDVDRAREWWHQLAAREPLNARAASGLMSALARTGDVPGALALARTYATLVREELGAEPDPTVDELAQRIRRGDVALEPLPATQATVGLPPAPAPPPGRSSRRRPLWPLVALAVAAAVALAAWMLERGSSPMPRAGTERIVIAPFTVLGSDDRSGWLSEGIPDLLAAGLGGIPGLQVVDQRRVIAVWREVASAADSRQPDTAELMRRTGSALMVTGRVLVRNGDQLELQIEVLRAEPSMAPWQFVLRGPMQSLSTMADRGAAEVASVVGREGQGRVRDLASRSLPTLRAYLAGRAYARRGEIDSAVTAFRQALDLDSTMALGGLELTLATGWLSSRMVAAAEGRIIVGQAVGPGGLHRADLQPVWRRAVRLARQYRDRLSAGDQAVLAAVAGRQFPRLTPVAERLQDWERAVALVPDRPETRFGHALALMYLAPSLDVPDALARAEAQLHRALELDPTYPQPWFGLAELDALRGATNSMRQHAARYLATNPSGENAEYLRWHVAAAASDTRALADLRRRFDSLSTNVLGSIAFTAQNEGIAVEDAVLALRRLLARAADRESRRVAYYLQALLALNRGCPHEAQDIIEVKRAFDPRDYVSLFQTLRFGLYWDGEPGATRSALHQLDLLVRHTAPSDTLVWEAPRAWHRARWFVAQAAGARGDTGSLRATLATLRAEADPESIALAIFLESQAVARRGGQQGLAAARRLDSLALQGCCGPFTSLAAARALADNGDVAGALRAVRRGRWVEVPDMLSAHLRLEGELALVAGDTTGALRAFRHFMALSFEPEARRRVEVDSLRRFVRRLSEGLGEDQLSHR